MARVLLLTVFIMSVCVYAFAGEDSKNADILWEKRDMPAALELYLKACSEKDARSCTQAGSIYQAGENGVTKDIAKAVIYYEKGCDMGNIYACEYLGRIYDENSNEEIETDYIKAASYYQKACEKDFTESCLRLADFYTNSKGVEKNLEKAHQYLKRAGMDVGDEYTEESDEEYNEEEYNEENEIAGEAAEIASIARILMVQGDTEGCLNLFMEACNMGNVTSCRDGGNINSTVKPDKETAIIFYNLGCQNGDRLSCFSLAFFYKTDNEYKDGSKVQKYLDKANIIMLKETNIN